MSRVPLPKCADKRNTSRTQFVRRYGIIGWGVPTAVLWTMLNGWDGWVVHLLISLAIFPIGGSLLGWLMWALFERRVRKSSGG